MWWQAGSNLKHLEAARVAIDGAAKQGKSKAKAEKLVAKVEKLLDTLNHPDKAQTPLQALSPKDQVFISAFQSRKG